MICYLLFIQIGMLKFVTITAQNGVKFLLICITAAEILNSRTVIKLAEHKNVWRSETFVRM